MSHDLTDARAESAGAIWRQAFEVEGVKACKDLIPEFLAQVIECLDEAVPARGIGVGIGEQSAQDRPYH